MCCRKNDMRILKVDLASFPYLIWLMKNLSQIKTNLKEKPKLYTSDFGTIYTYYRYIKRDK